MGRGRISGFHVWKTDMRFLLECNGPLAQPAGDGWNLVGVLSQECHMGRVYWAASVWKRRTFLQMPSGVRADGREVKERKWS
ncbi:hypothetical protein F220043C3_35360 [Enterocloster asparagiformis]